MTELLAKALDWVHDLPEDEQDRVAQLILNEVEAFGKENGKGEPQQKPYWEVIQDIMKDVPDEELEKLPKDGAAEIDHYIYGTPKRYS